MGVQNRFATWTFVAQEALENLAAGTGHLYKAVSALTGKLAANGQSATGILQEGGPNGSHVTEGYKGIMKFTAGAAISSKGVPLTVTTSGYFIAATSGSYIVGRYRQGTNDAIAISSGSVGTGLFDFTVPHYAAETADLL